MSEAKRNGLGKHTLRNVFSATGPVLTNSDVSPFDVRSEQQLVVAVENVGVTNEVEVKGRIQGQSSWTTLDTIVGASQSTIDITLIDEVYYECTVYDPSGSATLVASAFFKQAGGGGGGGSGDVVGPASSTNNDIAVFNGTTGKLIKDGGATIAQVKDRANHTGTQLAATISDFNSAADARVAAGITGKEDTANKGAANGYAPLDASTKIAAAYLPSYVDDVIEAADFASLPGTGETGKIYVTLDTNKTYRWSGSAYVEISASPGSTDAVTEGATNLYFTAARVRSTVLTGLSLATNQAIAATDTVLQAFGYLQKQITDLIATVAGKVDGPASAVDNDIAVYDGTTGKLVKDGGKKIVDVRLNTLSSNGDSNYSIPSTTRVAITSATLTAQRTWTLPAANSLQAGDEIIVADLFGAINGSNTLVISRAGSDTISGATSETIMSAYGMRIFITDGSSKWTIDKGVLRAGNNLSDLLSASTARSNLGLNSSIINALQHIMLDTSGDSFFEPYTILSTNGSFGHAVLRMGASNAAQPTVRSGVYGSFTVPQDFISGGTAIIEIIWTATLTSGNVVFDFDYRSIGGDDTTSLDQSGYTETLTVTDAAPTAANRRLKATITLNAANLAAGDTLEFFFGRDGADANDTMAGSALVHELRFKYTT